MPSAPKEAGLTRLDFLVVGSAHREGGGPHTDGIEVVVVKLKLQTGSLRLMIVWLVVPWHSVLGT